MPSRDWWDILYNFTVYPQSSPWWIYFLVACLWAQKLRNYRVLHSEKHLSSAHRPQSYSATRRYSTQMMSFYSISGKFCTNLLQRQCLRSIGYRGGNERHHGCWLAAAPLLSNNIWIRPCLMGCIKWIIIIITMESSPIEEHRTSRGRIRGNCR